MWPRSADRLYEGLDPRMSHYNEDNFQFYLVRMLERVTLCLEQHLGLELEAGKRLLPALLLFNPIDDPLWSDLGTNDGIGFTESARSTLKEARTYLAQCEQLRGTDPFSAAESYDAAVRTVADLPRPASTLLDRGIENGPEAFGQVVSELIEFYGQRLLDARTWRGNARAKRLAIRLRALTEHYTNLPINVGQDPEEPRGSFVECLDDLFKVVGLDVHFYRYARLACGLQSRHPELQKSLEVLRSI